MKRNIKARAATSGDRGGALVFPLLAGGSDEALVEALQRGNPAAAAELYDRYADHAYRVLIRILGFDDELEELLQDTFLEALKSIHTLKVGASLKAWLTSVAVFTARGTIRRRARRRWLRFRAPDKLPVQAARPFDADGRAAVKRVYELLDHLPPDERIPLSLRYLEEMELTEVAAACCVSLATIKRRLVRAERHFAALARLDPRLEEWIETSAKWSTR